MAIIVTVIDVTIKGYYDGSTYSPWPYLGTKEDEKRKCKMLIDPSGLSGTCGWSVSSSGDGDADITSGAGSDIATVLGTSGSSPEDDTQLTADFEIAGKTFSATHDCTVIDL